MRSQETEEEKIDLVNSSEYWNKHANDKCHCQLFVVLPSELHFEHILNMLRTRNAKAFL